MIYEASWLAIAVFSLFVAVTLFISFYMGRKAKSSQGYFAAHGQIPWFVNGIAFAGDYLSAASFLGICGMIAFYGYDGFLYSIGFLAGWIVALFVIAEPMKRLGKFTFADALDANFQSRSIKLTAGISTLAVSVFYLIPQMVGAGALVQPLLGWSHWVGVVMVGTVVILIVVTAGMVSTTWVQFLKGALLVFFSAVLVVMILQRGFTTHPGEGFDHRSASIGPVKRSTASESLADESQVGYPKVIPAEGAWSDQPFIRTRREDGGVDVWHLRAVTETTGTETAGTETTESDTTSEGNDDPNVMIELAQLVTTLPDGSKLVNGKPHGIGEGEQDLVPVGRVTRLPGDVESTGPVGPMEFFSTLQESEVVLWSKQAFKEADGTANVVYYQKPTPGSQVLRPGENPKFKGIRSAEPTDKLNFLSLMLALFCGTASLPHILIRYYTVKDEAAARKSTIVGIATIGFFYVLTLYLGLGAMTSGAMDVTSSNMAAPLLAKSLSEPLFAIISAIAFTTVLGTVSGLILASAGAIAHDLVASFVSEPLTDTEQVRIAKLSSVVVGAIAIVLGIVFEGMNVGFLVGWAFSVAASANLPSLVMVLFWKRVTATGIAAAVVVGMVSSLAWILLSADSFQGIYGYTPAEAAESALVPFSQPGIVTIPLGFVVVVVVSLLTQPRPAEAA